MVRVIMHCLFTVMQGLLALDHSPAGVTGCPGDEAPVEMELQLYPTVDLPDPVHPHLDIRLLPSLPCR